MSTTSDTPTPPQGYHIATEQERQCLPEGTKIWLVFDQEWGKSANIGRQADDGSLYACPDQPEAGKAEGKADPYAELKAAHATGKRIQLGGYEGRAWVDVGPEIWWSFEPPHHWRIHPDDLDPPAPQPSPEPAQPWQPALGDTVRLKSGGPVMVVKKTGEYVTCLFNTETGPHQCQVPTACITPAQP